MPKIGLLHRGGVDEMDALHELPVIDLVDVEIRGILQGKRLLLHYEP
jgi:hypothetical protein